MPAAPLVVPQTQFRIAEIDVNLAPSDEKITALFRIDSEQRGKKGPILVILAEISSTLYVYEQLLDTISQAAEQTRSLLSAVDTDCVVRFEKIVQKLNEAVASFASQEPTPITWNRVNIYVIEFSDHYMCLTGIGRMCSLFLQKQKDSQMRAFDLFGSLEQPAEVNPEKPFFSLICGDMQPGDILFAGTLNFERLRQELQIKERLINLPPVTACLEIRQDLERHNIPDQFCAMVVTHVARSMTPAIPVIEAAPEETEEEPDSVQKLHSEALRTESILAPTATPLQDIATPGARLKEKFTDLRDSVLSKARELRAPTKRAPRNQDPLTLTSLRGMSAGHGAILNDERKKKLAAFIVITVLLIGGSLWLYRARRYSAEQALWNTTLNQAIDRKNRAEGDLVYNNEDGARGLLKEASNLVAGLDEDTSDRKTAKQKFLSDLQEVQKKLKRETAIEQPTEVFATEGASGIETLSLYKGNLFTIDTDQNALVQVTPSTKETKRLPLPPETPKVLAAAVNNDAIVLFTEEHIVLLANPAKENVGIISFTFTNASSIQSVASYNNRLYALDPEERMIWRYAASGNTNYGQERPYLTSPHDPTLSDATALAIDSNVYVGFQNGQIRRLLSGRESPWNVRGIDPILTNVTALWASADSDRIIVLDRVDKRIVVLTKDGQLVSQITSPAFNDLRDVTVDATAKKIFVSNGGKVFQVALP